MNNNKSNDYVVKMYVDGKELKFKSLMDLKVYEDELVHLEVCEACEEEMLYQDTALAQLAFFIKDEVNSITDTNISAVKIYDFLQEQIYKERL